MLGLAVKAERFPEGPAGKAAMTKHETLVHAAHELAKAMEAVSTAERDIDDVSIEPLSACWPKQLTSDLKLLRDLVMREANRSPGESTSQSSNPMSEPD